MSVAAATTNLYPVQFVQTWAESMAQVLGEISGAPLPSAVLSEPLADIPPSSEHDLWAIAACSGAVRGEMSLHIPAASAVRLAQMFMSEPAAPDVEFSSDYREAALELLRQANGLFATAIKPRWGEVQIALDAASAAPSWPASSTSWLRFAEGAAASFIEFQFSAALMAALRAEKTDASDPSAPALSDVAPSVQYDDKVNLKALMDVELAVSLRFGSRRLLLREVLELSPGAVIELDRHVQEPVDMLLDGRVIARGEIVVMDGNYGLRVTEVAPAT